VKLIDGVRTKALRVIPDERGRVMEMLRRDEDIYEGFGQAYLTTAYPGVVKAWHLHRKQADNMVAVRGMMKVALYDPREESPSRGLVNEIFLGEHNPMLLHIPKGVYHGFKCVSETEAMVVNFPTEPYDHEDPDEYRIPPHSGEVPYSWQRKDG